MFTRTPTAHTQQLLEMIGKLYSIEADIRGKAPDERLRVRREKSKPLLVKFETTIRAKLTTLSTKSALASDQLLAEPLGSPHVLL